MDESKKTISERISEALKPTEDFRKAMEAINSTLKNVPNFQMPRISSPDFVVPRIPRMPTQEELNAYQGASALMEALSSEALEWKKRLPKEYKPAILAVMYGGIQIHVNSLAQVSFHGIRIEGLMNGAPCSLLAHQSTVQLLCYAEEVQAGVPRNRIGFVWDDNRVEV